MNNHQEFTKEELKDICTALYITICKLERSSGDYTEEIERITKLYEKSDAYLKYHHYRMNKDLANLNNS